MTSQFAATSPIVHREPIWALRFDAFELFPRRRVLLQNGEQVSIGGRAFDLLLVLATRPGEIVEHAELIRSVWPNRVVSNCNLKTQVGSLQKILGLTAEGGRYVKNVALRGYVFVAEVRAQPWPDLSLASVRDDPAVEQVRH